MVVGPGTVIAGFAGLALTKIFGPTLDLYGGDLKDYLINRKKDNFERICQNATEKIGDEIDNDGVVPPRVLEAIVSDGAVSDDPIWIEYFGGVLASSRTEDGKDDRGARIGKIIGRLSVFQIRAHYILYCAARLKHLNVSVDPENGNDLVKLLTNLSSSNFMQLMGVQDETFLGHSIRGLSTENLIQDYIFGSEDFYSKQSKYENVSEGHQISFQMNATGVELFMWATGNGLKPLRAFFDENLDVGLVELNGCKIEPL